MRYVNFYQAILLYTRRYTEISVLKIWLLLVMPSLLSKAFNLYRNAITVAFGPKYLFCTNVVISMSISTCGDLLEQTYEVHRKELDSLDFQRTGQMAFSGSTAGCICHHWYIILDKVIIGRSFAMVVKKLFLDQCICSPIVILSFFGTVAIFEDNPLESFTDEVSSKFWTLYKAEWIVWPPAQIINFYLLPTRYRVVYDNTISLGYDVYTSNVKHSNSLKKESLKRNTQANNNEADAI